MKENVVFEDGAYWMLLTAKHTAIEAVLAFKCLQGLQKMHGSGYPDVHAAQEMLEHALDNGEQALQACWDDMTDMWMMG